MPRTDLKALATEIKTLINNGVYSLYAVKNMPGVAYILVTNAQRAFALSADGQVLRDIELARLGEVEVGEPAFFVDSDAMSTFNLNYASVTRSAG